MISTKADFSLGIQNKLLDALLDYWQLKTPLVVGHDFGGTTVLRNHILNARAFEKIIVIDTEIKKFLKPHINNQFRGTIERVE